MTHIAFEGVLSPDGEPFIMPVGGVLDEQYMTGPISKERLEDLQLWSALQALAKNGATLHPLGIRAGEDPPDRWLIHGDLEWGTELTELTVEDIRTDLAWTRKFARDLQQRLRSRATDFSHLQGRTVTLAKQHEQAIPRDTRLLLEEIELALSKDKGHVGEDMDFSQGAPKRLGQRGIHGVHGVFGVTVNQNPSDNEINVSATSHLKLLRSEVIAALGKRVAEKDEDRCNQVLIVTCGRPDQKGYRCPYDHGMFLVLQDAIKAGIDILPKKPVNIRGVLIHLWETPNLISWEEGGDLPWSPQSGESYTTVAVPSVEL
jgi:hypothetical protein